MESFENIIKYIKKIKEKLNNNIYCTGAELEKDFYKINKLIGIGTNDVEYKNLNTLFKVQEFLINEVCEIHKNENDLVNKKLLSKNINIKKINKHINDAKRAFDIYCFNDSNYDYVFIGDLHSDTISLKRILSTCKFFDNVSKHKKQRLIFLGDYVDRGKAHIKTLEFILALKFIFPEQIYLLKGNHDDGTMIDNQIKLCVKKEDDEKNEDYFLLYLNDILNNDNTLREHIISLYLKFFNSLCNIVFVNNKMLTLLVVHGGIPRPKLDNTQYYNYVTSISDLTNDEIKDNINKTIKNNMCWSDPCDTKENLRENSGRFKFTIEHFNQFQSKIKFDLLIRGHEAEKKGYKKFFNDRLITLFSSGIILKNDININNETAYSEINPKIIKFNKSGQIVLLDLNN
ncbi:metallophosphoesterase family protein [Haloimpatiens sp. FM7330]|uniref:metallophosphoesterase family protein n=1 Tax=Haloimpatiens sp. FM7330 TaxID=3298610 RepID=UPI0036260E25